MQRSGRMVHLARWRELLGWTLVGIAAAGAELALLRVLLEVVGWPLPLASAVAAEVLILVKFLVSDRFVFGHAYPTLSRLAKYHGACAGALVVYWLVINGLGTLLAMEYTLAFVVGTAASFGWSLMTNFLWVWRR
jgi:putative flippase GtrA